MESQSKGFKQLVQNANKILIISHISPDPDALCSILLMGTTLKENYPDKSIRMTMEESANSLEFLSGYKDIVTEPLEHSLTSFKPDLIIMVDAMNFARCTRGDWQKVRSLVKDLGAKLAIIDHHEAVGVEKAEAYFNSGNPATIQEVYELLFHSLKLRKPEGYALTTMTGLYSDTGGFVYLTSRFRETLSLATELIAAGVSIEALKTRLNQFSEGQIKVVGELANNLTHNKDYSYSFISDGFMDDWLQRGKRLGDLYIARETFANNYIRNIEGRQWGFIISKDPRLGDNYYGVSFRSVAGTMDVSVIAAKLQGGGHKPAAGGKVQASSVQEAIFKVKQAIKLN